MSEQPTGIVLLMWQPRLSNSVKTGSVTGSDFAPRLERVMGRGYPMTLDSWDVDKLRIMRATLDDRYQTGLDELMRLIQEHHSIIINLF